jgi:ABC-type polysaccharide/polyol phosphate export permease
LYGYHVIVIPIEINDPASAFAMLMIAWISGVALGLALPALKPCLPTGVAVMSVLYKRANKMFVANSLPSFMLAMFDWNPLFHLIDQARGFAFINYFPRNSN